jgi:hypothetical protein
MTSEMSISHALCAAQGGLCFYCGEEFQGRRDNKKSNALNKNKWTRDHLHAASKGHKRQGNVVLACYACNINKGNREPTVGEIARAEVIHVAALRLLRAFNGKVPQEWVTLPQSANIIEFPASEMDQLIGSGVNRI